MLETNNKSFLDCSQEERLMLVQKLQQKRLALREQSRKKRSGNSTKARKPKTKKAKEPFKFDNPALQAMFEMLPEDYRKKFGVRA